MLWSEQPRQAHAAARIPWFGVVSAAALLVALGAADKASTTATSPIRPPGAWESIWIAGLACAFGAYVVGVWMARRAPSRLSLVFAIAVVIQLSGLTGPLLFSRDAYSYWDYGRLAAIHHVNPYAHEPDRVLPPSDIGYGEGLGTTIYGPAFTAASELHARVVGNSPRAAEILYRVAAAVGVLILLCLLAAFARAPVRAVAVVGWNPLFALHFGGAGHNDIWMLLFLIGGILLGQHGRHRESGLAWSASAFVKASTVSLLPLELVATARTSLRDARRLIAGLLVGGVGFSALSTALYGTAWISFVRRASTQLSQTSSLSLVFHLVQLGVPRAAAKLILASILVVAYVALLIEAWRRGRARLALAACLLIFTPAWLVPWYGSWPVALAAVEDDAAGLVAAMVATAYLLTDALPLPYL